MTELLYREDAYARTCQAKVIGVTERGGIVLDRTVFYAMAGGQPGDKGILDVHTFEPIQIVTTVKDENGHIVHVPLENSPEPDIGQSVTASLDWAARHRHMRIHTAMHLVCSLVPYPVTGGQIGAEGGRLDFDIPEAGAVTREDLELNLNRLIAENHPVSERWITDEELAANPGLVRTMSVKPPTGTGKVRLVMIGEDGKIDLQPCGGTHVKETREIGLVSVGRIESKGRQNKRIRISLLS
ncbi:MAG: alanyl-tRNA editing protein [Hyphomicrobiales bacterium]